MEDTLAILDTVDMVDTWDVLDTWDTLESKDMLKILNNLNEDLPDLSTRLPTYQNIFKTCMD